MGMGGRGSGRGRGVTVPPKNNPNSVVIGTNTSREIARSMSVQSDNTYDANANITIAIDDTIPLNGIIITDLSTNSSTSNTNSHLTDGAMIEINKNDPFGIGLSEKEMTHVTTENKLILIEVRTLICSIITYCFVQILIDTFHHHRHK